MDGIALLDVIGPCQTSGQALGVFLVLRSDPVGPGHHVMEEADRRERRHRGQAGIFRQRLSTASTIGLILRILRQAG